ncbi:MAG: type II toxin-antitoxin system VapC family toxin [Sulfuritalea sp.]|jgi:predicted nucleic-acid-binding protein|nr:type II toxin-antitoxin system VapC family toxin [Sulfuritalea sp.]MDP1982240.1 type II toxin-antitoxin system VapC family toxin [Sulfuritalea sp.]
MLAVDTNVLVRVLVDDPTALDQCRVARQTVSDAGEIFVSQVVQIETAWVLVKAYGLNKKRLQDTFGAIAIHPAFHLQRRDVFLSALQHHLTGSADFADCVILAESVNAGHELVTFDRKLGKLAGARLIAP